MVAFPFNKQIFFYNLIFSQLIFHIFSYAPGPMPLIMKVIVADLICAAYDPKTLCELISCNRDLQKPYMTIKAR